MGEVDAVELVTIGQRRGLGAAGGSRSYAIDVDVAHSTVTIGRAEDLLTERQELAGLSFVGESVEGRVRAQCSAHGESRAARLEGGALMWETPSVASRRGRASRCTTSTTPSCSAAPPLGIDD